MEQVNQKIKVNDLKERLSKIILAELHRLPETLDQLEPKERLNILCKFLPFIMPKLESMHAANFKWLSD